MEKNQNILNEKSYVKKKKKPFHKKFKNYNEYRKMKRLEALRKKAPKSTNYLHFNKKLKQGIFLKKPYFDEIKYPFFLNLKLVNEYIKKK